MTKSPHLNDNFKINKFNEIFSVCLFFETLGKEFSKSKFFQQEFFIHDKMVRYYGKRPGKMLMR